MSIKNVYSELASFEGLLNALHDVCAGNRYEKTELAFWGDSEKYLHHISDCLNDMNFPPDRYRTFYVYEPKLRKIVCSDFVTKLIHRSAYNVINPRICETLIEDTFSCIKDRGTLKAVQRLRGWIDYVSRSGGQWYYLKMDVEKFFYRIDHEILMNLTRKKIGDKRAVRFLEHYICEASMPFGLPVGVRNPMDIDEKDMLWDVGITIGGGLSHMQGNIYLDPIDQLAKRTLRIPYYIRYMDDMIILSDDKSELHKYRKEIENYLNEKLHLRLNRKTAIRPISQGIEFVGYRVWPGRTFMRKSTSLRMKRHLKGTMEKYRRRELDYSKARDTFMSYKAMLKHCDCKSLDRKIVSSFVLTHSTKSEIEAERELFGTRGYEFLDEGG